MKKLLLVLLVVFSGLYASTFNCMPIYAQQGNMKYKYSEKYKLNNTIIIKIQNNVLTDGHDTYNYIGTVDNVDYFKNKKHNLIFGILDNKKYKVYGAALVVNATKKNPTNIYFKCLKNKN